MQFEYRQDATGKFRTMPVEEKAMKESDKKDDKPPPGNLDLAVESLRVNLEQIEKQIIVEEDFQQQVQDRIAYKTRHLLLKKTEIQEEIQKLIHGESR